MKHSISRSVIILAFCVAIMNLNSGCSDKLEILIITGGHSFDTIQFFDFFKSYETISYDAITQPEANKLLEKIGTNAYDVLVFYDMWQEITENQQNAYDKLLEKGTGMVFLHHSLVSYQQWGEYINIIGGKYWQEGFTSDSLKLSDYEHDLDLDIKVLDRDHPITKDMQDFRIHDEGYSNVEIISSVVPLLETSHPFASKYVAWTNEYKQSRIVYIMLGHDYKAYENESFRKLVENAIIWAAN